MQYEYRNRSEGVEVEEISDDGRIIEGWALRWDTPYRVSDDGRSFYQEQWKYRATARSIVNRRNMFELQVEHGNDRVGHTEFLERNEGLWFHAVVEPDREDVIEDVKSGRKQGVSVRYAPVHVEKLRDDPNDVMVQIVEARLREFSITDNPQYKADARIEVLRAQDELERRTAAFDRARAAQSRYASLRMA